jgi:Tfp pilus assembly protein PilZ
MPVRVSTIDPETDPRTGRLYFRATREYCANLSRGGAFIETSDPLAPGRRILVEIHVPEGEPIEAIGRVAWSKTVLTSSGGCEGSGVGVEFLGSSGDQLTALANYLEIPPKSVKPSEE